MFKELIGNYNMITLIGLCKNAGKTTTVCKLLEEYADEIVGITSVGRDGETTDLVSGTDKPQLWIKAGTYFATARGMLSLCDVTIEVIGVTPYTTPFGKIALFKALSSGYVQLAGPSIVSQLKTVCDEFIENGATRMIIDGAAGRKSLAGAAEETCAILCVGASFDSNMEKTILETKHICDLFGIRQPENKQLLSEIINTQEKFARFTLDGDKKELDMDDSNLPNFTSLERKGEVIWIRGAVTTSMITGLSRKGIACNIVVPDATCLLCNRKSTQEFIDRGGRFFAKREIEIVAISVNPWSAYGSDYDNEAFIRGLREQTQKAVFNVKDGV